MWAESKANLKPWELLVVLCLLVTDAASEWGVLRVCVHERGSACACGERPGMCCVFLSADVGRP